MASPVFFFFSSVFCCLAQLLLYVRTVDDFQYPSSDMREEKKLVLVKKNPILEEHWSHPSVYVHTLGTAFYKPWHAGKKEGILCLPTDFVFQCPVIIL